MRFKLLLAAVLLCLPLTAYAGTDLGMWKVTRYYTPVEGQDHYYNGWKDGTDRTCKVSNLYYAGYGAKRTGDYSAEACMQGSGDLFITADGTDLRTVDPYSVAACPAQYLGRTLHIAEIGYVRCVDTGGSVKGKTVDVWAGIGEEGYEKIHTAPSGLLQIHLKDV